MPIPLWCIILVGVVLLIILLLLIKVKIVIQFKGNHVIAYRKILFFKSQIYPKEKNGKDSEALASLANQVFESDDPKQIARTINVLRRFITRFFTDILGKIHITSIKIDASVGGSNASNVALAHGLATQSASYFIGFLNNYSNFKPNRKSHIDIRPDFLSSKSWIDIDCSFHLHIFTVLFLRLETISTLFKIENFEEILSEVIKNGTIETK